MLRYIIFFSFVLSWSALSAQKAIQVEGSQFEYKGIVYNKELAYNITLHNNGFYMGVDLGTIKTYYQTRFYHISVGHIRHRDEERQNKGVTLEGFGSSLSFVYGKQNFLFPIRAGVGTKRYFSEKAKRKGLAVGWTYELGPILGILKPYEIIAIKNGPSGLAEPVHIIYSDDPDLFMSYNKIFGRSSFLSQMDKIKLRPGIHAKAGAHFAWGAFDKYVRALEVGILTDFYFTKVPIIVENEKHRNSPIFINLYVTLQFGKRT